MRVAKLRAQEIAWRRQCIAGYGTIAYRRPLWSQRVIRVARILALILLLTVADLLRAFL